MEQMFALADENSKTLKREDAAVAVAQQGVMVANNTKRDSNPRCAWVISRDLYLHPQPLGGVSGVASGETWFTPWQNEKSRGVASA